MLLFLFSLTLTCFLFLVALLIGRLVGARLRLRRRLTHVLAAVQAEEAATGDTQASTAPTTTEGGSHALPQLEKLWQQLMELTARYFPLAWRSETARRLNQAGFSARVKPEAWLTCQFLLALVAALVFFLLGAASGAGGSRRLLWALLGMVLGMILPELLLRQRIGGRQQAIRRALPDVLDILTVSVEAGLGFDAALARVVERLRGPLAEELQQVLHELWLGRGRREALRDLGIRSGVEDLRLFTAAIIQADQLGTGLGAVLRVQAEQMRQKRRQRAEEAAMKAPVKMLIPMVLFIFPTIFIILLGPALIQLLQAFAQMR